MNQGNIIHMQSMGNGEWGNVLNIIRNLRHIEGAVYTVEGVRPISKAMTAARGAEHLLCVL